MLTDNAKKILEKRYFIKDKDGKAIENWEGLCTRVSKALSKVEKESDKWEKEFFSIINSLEFLPSSPFLFNAGTDKSQLFACFVLEVGDSMESIFQVAKDAAKIFKSGGGVGFYLGHLRPSGALVGGTRGVSSGPVSFAQLYDTTIEVVKQGGVRRGAGLGCLPVNHPDIENFIVCKSNKKAFQNLNMSVGITDEFMRAVDKDEEFNLSHPKFGVTKTIKAKKLWHLICKNAHATGDPGILFIDNINKFNPLATTRPQLGTNPCGERPLPHMGSCCLGSINLTKFVINGEVNYKRLEEVTMIAIRFLDNAIDVNQYPLPETEKEAKETRRIGLGVMGFADMLIMMNIKYDSNEAVKFADQLMTFINKIAYETSVELGKEKGNFSAFEESIFFHSKSHKKTMFLRNSERTCIAPTGTIGIIAGVSSGIEPNFGFEIQRESSDKINLDWIHPLYSQVIKDNGGKIPKKLQPFFVTASEIDPEFHIKVQQAFQLHTDAAVSKTINLSFNTSIKEIKRIYEWAHKLGLKGITVFRDGCKGKQVLNSFARCPECGRHTLNQKSGCDTCLNCGFSKCDIKLPAKE